MLGLKNNRVKRSRWGLGSLIASIILTLPNAAQAQIWWGDYWINLQTRNIGQCLREATNSITSAGGSNVSQRLGESASGSIRGNIVIVICSPDGSQAIIISESQSACNAVAVRLERDRSARQC